jgi:hypothetical protein
MRRALVAAAFAALLAAAPAADAEVRYAAPTGSGTACSQATPCPLAEAITEAEAGDEVIITAGSYAVGPTLMPKSPKVFVHGDFSGPMPKIIGTGMGGNVPIGVPAADGRLSYLEITSVTGSKAFAAACNPGGTIERVRLFAEGSESIALTLIGEKCAVRDSVIVARGSGARGILAYGFLPSTIGGLARNLTVLATGPGSVGIRAEYTSIVIDGSYTLDLKNSIVNGESSDLLATKGSSGSGNIAVTNSNFDDPDATAPATISGGPNQTTPPLFVDAAAGDYREAPGSPTIDAGSTEGIGPLDLAGSPRLLGPAPDIGAFEFVPAPASPPPVAALTSLEISPKAFRPRKGGGSIVSATKQKGKPGSTVRYGLTSAAQVGFTVERALKGRKVGGKCRKQTAANRDRKRCTRYKALKGGFSHAGAAGQNSFKFSGRIRGKALSPGKYRLVGRAGDSVRRATFTITG